MSHVSDKSNLLSRSHLFEPLCGDLQRVVLEEHGEGEDGLRHLEHVRPVVTIKIINHIIRINNRIS